MEIFIDFLKLFLVFFCSPYRVHDIRCYWLTLSVFALDKLTHKNYLCWNLWIVKVGVKTVFVENLIFVLISGVGDALPGKDGLEDQCCGWSRLC